MDHLYQTTMLLPASYAVISEEEMTYLDGGKEILLGSVFGYDITFNTDQFVYHTWDKLNGWSKLALFGIGTLAGYYAYGQVVSIIRTVKNIYNDLVNPMPAFNNGQASDTAAA